MKKIFVTWALLFLVVGNLEILYAGSENWRDDFDRICAHTADAGRLGHKGLSSLIAESDELLEIIGSGNDPGKKLYIIRLKKCRNFFVFMQGLAKNSADN